MGKNFLLATAENDKREYYPMFEITFGHALHFPLFLNRAIFARSCTLIFSGDQENRG